MSTSKSVSEKTNEQFADLFATPVGSRVVLDTSVLIADPNCLASFPNCAIVIPLTVIEELDGLKTRMDDVGRAAR
ncbi:MAG: PIN domain-containing protein, partial [Acidimicrobiaceae bacterium]